MTRTLKKIDVWFFGLFLLASLIGAGSAQADETDSANTNVVEGNGHTDLAPGSNGRGIPACPRPPAFAQSPGLQSLVDGVCGNIASALDHKTGGGNGELVNNLERLQHVLLHRSARVTIGDVHNAGLDYESLKRLINEETGGRGMTVEVVAYRQMVDRANSWLKKSGFGFFHVVQHPKALAIEKYRNFVAIIPREKGVTEADVKAASDAAYPNNKPHEIRLPINPEELSSAATRAKFPNFELLGDADVPLADAEPLPPESEPLAQDKHWYRRLQAVRFGITMAVMGTATASAAYMGDGKLTPEAVTVFLAGLGLEAQFIGLSKYWRHFWAGWGFTGNALVNFSYGALLASVQHLTEFMQGIPSTFDRDTFLIRTAVLGATFIASFGGMQVVSAKMKEEGEYSEGGAMWLESIGNIINNFGRFFAITAGVVGTGVTLGHLGPVQFGTNEAVGWAIQGGYLALITAPLWFKRLAGDDIRAGLIAYNLTLHQDESHPYNSVWFGGVRKWCAERVADFTRWLTPVRTRK